MNCTGKTKRASVPPVLAQAVVDFLRHDALVLEPRVWWPKPALADLEKVLPGALDRYESGQPKMVIPKRLRAQEGRVLCMYGDAGWGTEVARGKYQTGLFSDALVKAAAELIQGKWKPEPPPQWVTAIPSQRHAELVRDFAERLAASMGLPFVPALRQLHEAQPQKEMRCSSLQLRNVLRAFEVVEAPALARLFHTPSETPTGGEVGRAVPCEPLTSPRRAEDCAPYQPRGVSGVAGMFQRLAQRVGAGFGNGPTLPPVPVLLVDDMVDSGWTLTLAAVLLQHHGSGPVYPFALAKASPRGS